jgi:hypothetical protein
MKVYLRANQSYWFNISPDIGTDPPSIICLYQTSDLDRKFCKLNSRELSRIGIEHTAKGEHEVYFGDEVIFISPTKSRILSRSSSQKQNL